MSNQISVSQIAMLDLIKGALEDELISETEREKWAIDIDQSLSLDSFYPIDLYLEICALVQLRAKKRKRPIGLFPNRKANFSKYGKLGFASIAVKDLEAFINLGNRAMPLFLPKVTIALAIENNKPCVVSTFGKEYAQVQSFIAEYCIAEFKRFEAYFENPIEMTSLHFTHSASGPVQHYEQFFGCPVYFDQPVNHAYLTEATLKNPTLTSNEETYHLLFSQLESKLKNIETELTTAQKVEALWQEYALKQQFLSLQDVADKLATSSRTLARQLANEGTSYKEICHKIRAQMAIHLLKNSNISIGEIAYQLGFKEANAFHRFFKKQFGTTPSEARLK